jgi:hypothetical protein
LNTKIHIKNEECGEKSCSSVHFTLGEEFDSIIKEVKRESIFSGLKE